MELNLAEMTACLKVLRMDNWIVMAMLLHLNENGRNLVSSYTSFQSFI